MPINAPIALVKMPSIENAPLPKREGIKLPMLDPTKSPRYTRDFLLIDKV
jgi:hypothetical protein